MSEKYIVTGNEYVSLPDIRESDGSIGGLSFLHMGAKGMLEMRGSDTEPFLKPWVRRDGEALPLTDFRWTHSVFWIPSFTAQAGDVRLVGQILAPVGNRGFGIRLKLEGAAPDHTWELGVSGCWDKTLHSINESKPVDAEQNLYHSNWNHNCCMDIRVGLSLFAFAPIMTEDWNQTLYHHWFEKEDQKIRSRLWAAWEPGQLPGEAVFWFGLGFEEVAAATSAKEMLRQGFDTMLAQTERYLARRVRHTSDPILDEKLNRNLFFSFFFGSGKTLDTEEYVLVTSRSPRYYVSAAYWDRDSLLWSFPAIVLVDPEAAEEMLRYIFTRQIRNVGIHSRYIDGTVLEPGFELDELCAPIIALARYVEKTGDRAFLQKSFVEEGVALILKRLNAMRHPELPLYETFLQPTDDLRTYPYITYDNVLVWYSLRKLAELYTGIWSEEKCAGLLAQAEAVDGAIRAHCVFQKDGKAMFAWSVDLKGGWDVYDEPPGSLLLLPHYGYCSLTDPVWQHTAAVIRREDYRFSFAGCPIAEIGCAHAPHPWILSLANSMLSDRKESARRHLLLCAMDNGIACESVDEYTGESATGNAFATCAGFLAYALYEAFGI